MNVNLTASSRDEMNATTTVSKSVAASGSTTHWTSVSLMGNRIVFGSPQEPGVLGPTLVTDIGPYELGVSFWLKKETRITGARIYKHPDLAGSIPLTLWDDAGTALATTTVTWTADTGGWREIRFPTPSAVLPTGREYRVSYFAANGSYAYTAWVYNAQDYWEYPFWVKGFTTVSGVNINASVIRADTHGVPDTHIATCYYVDVLGEVQLDMPAYRRGYMDQWVNHVPAQPFPVGVFYCDPEFIADYAATGVTTLIGIPATGDAYRAAILAANVDIWPSIYSVDSLKLLLSDPELAAKIRGWFVHDEPDLAGTWQTPEEIRTLVNQIRAIDSTRPIMLNFGMSISIGQGWFFLRPGGKDIVGHFDELIEDMGIADVISLDHYNLEPSNSGGRWGPWTYYKQVKRLQQFSLGQRPVWGYVETTSQDAGYPTPASVKQATWAALIAGAKGIVFFDHRFGDLATTQDFAALLHDAPMKAVVTALASDMQSIAGHLNADEADLVVWFSSSNTSQSMLGGTTGVPIYYTSRIYNGQRMIIAQAARPGTTTGSFQVPSAAGMTLTVRGEGRTVTADSSGIFTDTFTSDYQVHIYVWTPATGRDTLVPGTYKPSTSTTGTTGSLTAYNTGGSTITVTMDNQVFQNLDIYGDVKVQAGGVQFINCRLRGGLSLPTSQTGIVDARHANAVANPPLLLDCTIAADRPSYYRDGIMGSFIARRCDISNVNDGCGIYNTSTSTGANATVEACYIHDLVYWYPDPAHSDGTHNDCIQIQSGGNIHIIGNYLKGTSLLGDDRPFGGSLSGDDPDKPTILTQTGGPHINGSCVLVQQNTGVALSNSVIVEKNWLSHGLTGANLQAGTYTFRNNTVDRASFYFYSGNPNNQYPVRPTSSTTGATVSGLYTTNRYEDDGELLTEANAGIRY
ncbi:MAG: DUF4082 domain-containing protein [Arthrobacter sp.]